MGRQLVRVTQSPDQMSVRDQGKCVQVGSTEDLHFDHKVPWSRGGTNTVNNIQLLCGRCNRRKGADDIQV
jgi:5-methylcytosine-specific restriction endonuclease McrA